MVLLTCHRRVTERHTAKFPGAGVSLRWTKNVRLACLLGSLFDLQMVAGFNF
jgi:hypothetical protein